MDVDQRDRNAGFLGHDGVFCETSGLARFLQMPLFVREVKLVDREDDPPGRTRPRPGTCVAGNRVGAAARTAQSQVGDESQVSMPT